MTNRSDAAKRGGQTQRVRAEKLRREMTLRALTVEEKPSGPLIAAPFGSPIELISLIRIVLDDLERSLQ